MPAAPTNLKFKPYPPANILFYWDPVAGATSYNLYRKPHQAPAFVAVNATPIPPVKIQYPLMPVDVLPPGVVSTDPFFNKWATLDKVNSSDWMVRAVDGGESLDSNVVTFFPRAVLRPDDDKQYPRVAQMQYWDVAQQKYMNWEGNIKLNVGEIDIGNVGILDLTQTLINPSTKEKQQEIINLLSGMVGANFIKHDVETSVAAATSKVIVDHVVPAGKTLYLKHAKFSGNNYSRFTLKIDTTVVEEERTSDGKGLAGKFVFEGASALDGLKVSATQTVSLSVVHTRPWLGDYEGTLYGRLV